MPGEPSIVTGRGRVLLGGALAIYTAVYLSWMVVRWGPAGSRSVIGDLFQTGFNAAVVWMSWRAARRCESAAPLGCVWRLITVSAVLGLLSNCAQLYYEGFAGGVPSVSLVDGFSLCVYVPVLAALVRFPIARASGVQRLQLALDAAVLAIAGFIVMWYVELGPALTHPINHSPAQDVVSALFTIGDLIVLAVAAGVLIRGTNPASTRALRLFASGCLVFVGVHVLYGYATIRLHLGHRGGDWLDPVWYLGFVLWALAANAQRVPEAGELERLRRSRPLRRHPSWAPNIAIGTGLGLLVYAERDQPFFPVLSVLSLCLVLVALVAARQLAAQRELLDVQGELTSAHDELAALATTDALTGLPNHRALVAAIDREVGRAHRSGGAFALAFLDLDHFKALNDTLGHPAGDSALLEVGQVVRRSLRAVDTIGRWGGEEFVILLPDSDARAALDVAERVRAAIAHHRFAAAAGAHLTCSIGVATQPEAGTDRHTLLAAADQAMYVAKQLGRNQVVAAENERIDRRAA